MAQLQTCVDPEHLETFYKGAMLSNDTLERLGFVGYTEVIQEPGEVVTSHSFHCGLGMQKIAEAHSWFSKEWYRLVLENAPELPVYFPGEKPDSYDEDDEGAPTVAAASAAMGGSKRRKVTANPNAEAGPAS